MINKRITLFLIGLTLVTLLALPVKIQAKTIAEFEAEVKKYTKELEDKKASLAKNDAEVAQIEKQIRQTEQSIQAAEAEIERLEQEIIQCQEEIEKKSEESKNIMAYYQVSNGENSYLEYAFGAEDITDMIYRLSIVEQLTEYNDKVMKELEELIKKNEQSQKDLAAKEEELKKLQAELQKEKARINAESAHIKESMPSISDQIKAAQESVRYYKNLGCGASEDIRACEYRVSQASNSSLPSVGFFSRPMTNGYVTRGKSSGHLGYDFSSSNKTIAIYPIAEGIVHKIYTDSCTSSYPNWCRQMGFSCNGNAKIVVIKHNYNGQFIYSSYVHLSSYGNISEGQFVSRETVIGYMGTSGCSTGSHLHLEVAYCFWQKGGCSTYNQYLNNIINPANLIKLPSSWNNR